MIERVKAHAYILTLVDNSLVSREDTAPRKLWTEVGTVVGFLSTINRELCFPVKAEANLPATLEKIQRYVN